MGMVTDYLVGILSSVERDIREVLEYHCSSGKDGGYHNIPRDVFCYIDHIGDLVYGDGNGGKRFLGDYLGVLNSRYRTVIGQLVYDMWRNGTVHEYDPKVWTWRNGEQSGEIGWVVSNSPHTESRRLHLQCVQKEAKLGSFGIVLNLNELVEDLIRALKMLIMNLGQDKVLREECQRRYEKICGKKPLPEGLLHQVLETTAPQNIAGTINKDGNLISPHDAAGTPSREASERDP